MAKYPYFEALETLSDLVSQAVRLSCTDAYKKELPIDYAALQIPNDFIVGYGLDYNQLGRQYKDIYVLDESGE